MRACEKGAGCEGRDASDGGETDAAAAFGTVIAPDYDMVASTDVAVGNSAKPALQIKRQKTTHGTDAQHAALAVPDEQDASNLIFMSVCDYGGQAVFQTIQHLYMPRLGVYVLVFKLLDAVDRHACGTP